jgi:two-component system sensor histidine kinase YesM
MIQPLNNVKLRKRIIFSNIFINILLVFIIAVWLDKNAYNQMLEQGSYSLTKNFNQSLSYINSRLENTINLSSLIIFNTYLNSIINKEATDIINVNADSRTMRSLIRSFEDSTGINHARIYLNDSWDLALDGNNICSLSQIKDSTLLEQLFKKKGVKLFVGSSHLEDSPSYAEQVLSMFRVMYSTNNYKKVAFVLRLDLKKQDFINILSNNNPTSDSLSFLLDSDHTVIASSGDIPDQFSSAGIIDNMLEQPDDDMKDITIDRNKYLILKSRINLTDWSMITLVPYSSFFINFKETTRIIVLISVLIILISFVLFTIISYTITKRILVLCKYIEDAKTGELVPIDAPIYKDEIGVLYQNYNGMISQIKKLLKDNYNMGRDLRSAEYKALQSQINPHFLYNTLDMISWFSLQGRREEINEVVYSLAKFYKISLSKGKDIIAIKDEIEHTECYISIQKHRFSNRITYIKDVDPDILSYFIPKITIQPLIENAILHGILEKETNEGIIEIRGRIEDNIIHIMIIDNGKGMNSILQTKSNDTGNHYGLQNIDLRLKLLYGSDYGLSIESTYGIGTVIHIHIPTMKENDLPISII